MDDLTTLILECGHDVPDDDVLQTFLNFHNGDINNVINNLLDSKLSIQQYLNRLLEGSTPRITTITPIPNNRGIIIAGEPIIFRNISEIRMFQTKNQKPNTTLNHFPDLDNGDCLFFCMWNILNILRQTPSSLNREEGANSMRTFISNFIQQRWMTVSAISGMMWSETITLTHNTAISNEELSTYGKWGDTPEEQLRAWINERDSIFPSTPEITAFLEWLNEMNIPMAIRIWRQYSMTSRTIQRRRIVRNGRNNLIRSYCICNRTDHNQNFIIADLQHTGDLDTDNAHYLLFQNASFSTPRTITSINRRSTTEEYEAQNREPNFQSRPRSE
jgi:hypothetical protein